MAAFQIGLIFHGIGAPLRDLEPGEAAYWISKEQLVCILDQICELSHPDQIRISFDDGNLSDVKIGLPLLLERGLRADFFVLTGRIGRSGSLDVGDIQALQAAGMGIGSHGVDHLKWSNLEPNVLRAELQGSRHVLEHICGKPVQSAAIPFGAYNSATLRALRAAGYISVYSSDAWRMDPTAFLRPRCSVTDNMGPTEIHDILTARMVFARRVRRTMGMLRKRLL